jgi:hypothetical protein
MILRVAGALTVLAMVAACGADDGREPAAGVTTDVLNQEAAPPASEMTGAVALACEPSQMPLADRPSPYDSTMVNVGRMAGPEFIYVMKGLTKVVASRAG